MQTDVIPLINGQAYSWVQLEFGFLGIPNVTGVKSIEYSEKQEKEDIWYEGRRPAMRGYGEIKASGKITMSMTLVEAIQNSVGNVPLSDIAPFDLSVAWISASGLLVKHVLKNVEFMDNNMKASQGDKNLDRDFELIISHVDWNKA
jgi:hypothetical protein